MVILDQFTCWPWRRVPVPGASANRLHALTPQRAVETRRARLVNVPILSSVLLDNCAKPGGTPQIAQGLLWMSGFDGF